MGEEYKSVPVSESTRFIAKATREGLNGFYTRIGLSEMGLAMSEGLLELTRERAAVAGQFVDLARRGVRLVITTDQMGAEWRSLNKFYETMGFPLVTLDDGKIVPDWNVSSLLDSAANVQNREEDPRVRAANHAHLVLKHLSLMGAATFEDVGLPLPLSAGQLGLSMKYRTYWNEVTPANTWRFLGKMQTVLNTDLVSSRPVEHTRTMYEAAHFFAVANNLAENFRFQN